MTQGHAFDVATVLGIGTPSSDPLPTAAEGEIVLRVAEGLSLRRLYDCNIETMYWHMWYERFDWCQQMIPGGTYRLRVALPWSFRKTFADQEECLARGEQVASVALVAAALLCAQRSGGCEPLKFHQWTRCIESINGEIIVAVTWSDGRVNVVGSTKRTRHDRVGLAAMTRIS